MFLKCHCFNLRVKSYPETIYILSIDALGEITWMKGCTFVNRFFSMNCIHLHVIPSQYVWASNTLPVLGLFLLVCTIGNFMGQESKEVLCTVIWMILNFLISIRAIKYKQTKYKNKQTDKKEVGKILCPQWSNGRISSSSHFLIPLDMLYGLQNPTPSHPEKASY